MQRVCHLGEEKHQDPFGLCARHWFLGGKLRVVVAQNWFLFFFTNNGPRGAFLINHLVCISALEAYVLLCDLPCASGFRSFFCRHEDLPFLPRWELSENLFTDSVTLLEAVYFICELVASALQKTSIHFLSVSLRSWSSFCLVCFLRTLNTILSPRSESCRVPKLQVFAKFCKAVI